MDKLKQFMQKFKKIFIAFVVFIVVAIIGGTVFFLVGSYGDGYRVGNVTKLARKGVLFHTWEGELTQGFLESAPSGDASGGVATRLWYFTAEDAADVLSGIDRSISHGKRVKLFYKERFTTLPWVGDTRHVVYKVEEVQ